MSALVVLAVTVAVLLVAPAPALAQTDDVVDSWDVSYTVDSAGLLHVSETLVWRFGSSSGRHGIKRQIPVREQWGKKKDMKDVVYEISDIAVSSPDASAEFTTSTDCDENNPRSCLETIRVGDPDERITADTAQYTIDYTVSGVLRSSGDYDELYWDVVGVETPDVTALTVRADVPGGAQDVSCFAGMSGSTDECTSRTITDGTATFTQSGKKKGAILTVGVKITSGLVADVQPHLTDAAQSGTSKGHPSTPEDSAEGPSYGPLIGGLGTTVVILFLLLFSRRLGRRDERFADVPPGMIPAEGARVRADTRKDRRAVPVRVIPPDVPVAVGSLLLDRGRRKVQKTSAVLVDLAVRGVVQLRASDDGEQYYARLVHPELITQSYEQDFVNAIFDADPRPRAEVAHLGIPARRAASVDLQPGAEAALHESGVLERANGELDAGVAEFAMRSGLMRGLGKIISTRGGSVRRAGYSIRPIICFSVVFNAIAVFLELVVADQHHDLANDIYLPLIILNLGLWAIFLRWHGQRTALGRALTDQVEGFRKYLEDYSKVSFQQGETPSQGRIYSRLLNSLPEDHRGRADPVRGGAGHLQQVPALGHRLRADEPVDHDLPAAHRTGAHPQHRPGLVLR